MQVLLGKGKGQGRESANLTLPLRTHRMPRNAKSSALKCLLRVIKKGFWGAGYVLFLDLLVTTGYLYITIIH